MPAMHPVGVRGGLHGRAVLLFAAQMPSHSSAGMCPVAAVGGLALAGICGCSPDTPGEHTESTLLSCSGRTGALKGSACLGLFSGFEVLSKWQELDTGRCQGLGSVQ